MTPNQLKQTLESALKNQRPSLYAQMKADGTLAATLNDLAATAEQSISDARQMAIAAATSEGQPGYVADPLLRQQTLNSQFKEAENVAISQAVEQIAAMDGQPAA